MRARRVAWEGTPYSVPTTPGGIATYTRLLGLTSKELLRPAARLIEAATGLAQRAAEHRALARDHRDLVAEEVESRRPSEHEHVHGQAHPRNDRSNQERRRGHDRDDHAEAKPEIPGRQSTDDDCCHHNLIVARGSCRRSLVLTSEIETRPCQVGSAC